MGMLYTGVLHQLLQERVRESKQTGRLRTRYNPFSHEHEVYELKDVDGIPVVRVLHEFESLKNAVAFKRTYKKHLKLFDEALES